MFKSYTQRSCDPYHILKPIDTGIRISRDIAKALKCSVVITYFQFLSIRFFFQFIESVFPLFMRAISETEFVCHLTYIFVFLVVNTGDLFYFVSRHISNSQQQPRVNGVCLCVRASDSSAIISFHYSLASCGCCCCGYFCCCYYIYFKRSWRLNLCRIRVTILRINVRRAFSRRSVFFFLFFFCVQ